MTQASTDPTSTDPTSTARPGRKFARALRRADALAYRTAPGGPESLVRDERRTVWQRWHCEGLRGRLARYATSRQVARNREAQRRQGAAAAVEAAEEAHDEAAASVARAVNADLGRREVSRRSLDARLAGKALRDARAFAAAVDAGTLPDLPSVPRVPPPGEPVEVPYVSDVAPSRYAGLPAGTRAAHRRTYLGGLPDAVLDRARRAGARVFAQAERRQPRSRAARKAAREDLRATI